MITKNIYVHWIISSLEKAYPAPKTELENWKNPIQFMVCVILSAQATDKGVNKISRELFSRYKNAGDFAKAKQGELKKHVKSINYYKTKAKRIIDACRYVKENFSGELPKSIDKLVQIPGIGRKSANVILQEALGESQGIVVDTHVTRLSYRLGLTPHNDQKDAEKIEQALQRIIPKNKWQFYSSAAVLHGRYICKAKSPNCKECVLNKKCPASLFN
ncbi:endonuclease III [candidate division WWE3 bacterium RIFCSPLOWO2_01_FULL_39_13]|uniref:Endonuclease III n=1 Tax=candidate division WWE3 bacterium RIFCSPLOWO2_01_FULL_39_13 TaxID=1802624 RepID=A0A1F4V1U8_UNCKA|nr:MAG: endonuclease III [candidate division WWE3 bacterium RIFCSPLOWO2_01_FULL_39_13]